MSSRAHVLALWWLRATGDGRVQDGEAAVTRQLVETYKEKEIGIKAVWPNIMPNIIPHRGGKKSQRLHKKPQITCSLSGRLTTCYI